MVIHGGGPNPDAFTWSDTGRARLVLAVVGMVLLAIVAVAALSLVIFAS